MENATNPHHHWIVDFFDTPTKSTKTLLGTWANLLPLPCARNSKKNSSLWRDLFDGKAILTARGKPITNLYHDRVVAQGDREENPAADRYPVLSKNDQIAACMPKATDITPGDCGKRQRSIGRAWKHRRLSESSESGTGGGYSLHKSTWQHTEGLGGQGRKLRRKV